MQDCNVLGSNKTFLSLSFCFNETETSCSEVGVDSFDFFSLVSLQQTKVIAIIGTIVSMFIHVGVVPFKMTTITGGDFTPMNFTHPDLCILCSIVPF